MQRVGSAEEQLLVCNKGRLHFRKSHCVDQKSYRSVTVPIHHGQQVFLHADGVTNAQRTCGRETRKGYLSRDPVGAGDNAAVFVKKQEAVISQCKAWEMHAAACENLVGPLCKQFIYLTLDVRVLANFTISVREKSCFHSSHKLILGFTFSEGVERDLLTDLVDDRFVVARSPCILEGLHSFTCLWNQLREDGIHRSVLSDCVRAGEDQFARNFTETNDERTGKHAIGT